MFARLLALAILSTAAFALDNSVTVHNNYTSAQANHPVWLGRWFAAGEILNFPRSYVTPSDTGTRAAATTWQATVLNRWRDTTASRTITGARITSPCWNSGASGGCGTLGELEVVGDVATMETGAAHGLAYGDRLALNVGSPADLDLLRDNYSVYEVTSSTVVKFLVRGGTGTGQVAPLASPGYVTGFTIKRVIDPIAPDNCHYISANHGFYKGESVTISGIVGMTGANTSGSTVTIVGVSRNEFVTSQTCTGTWASGGTATGPDNGSVRFALIALKTTIPANGNVRVDFVNDSNPSSAGDLAATIAAGYSKAEMLAASWGAEFVATANVQAGQTAAFTTSARDMLTAWNGTESYCGPRYWAVGPVLTKFILRYECPASIGATISDDMAWQGANPANFGWKIVPGSFITSSITSTTQNTFTVNDVTNITAGTRAWFTFGGRIAEVMLVQSVDVGTKTLTVQRGHFGSIAKSPYNVNVKFGLLQWKNAGSAADKSITSGFTLRFVPDWGTGVRVESYNTTFTRMQSLWYSPVLKTGSTPTTRLSINECVGGTGVTCEGGAFSGELKHPNRSTWTWSTWDGADPEFYCQAGAGTDPENCVGTGGGTRAARYRIDHNTPYLIYARALPQYRLFTGMTASKWNRYPPQNNKGFDFSDKGRVGVTRVAPNYPTSESYPGLYLGGATYGAQPGAFSIGNYQDSPAEEGGYLEAQQSLFIQDWSKDGYEYNFCHSCPGGAGAVAVEGHMTGHFVDDDATYARPYYFGFSDLAYGRPPSLTARPSWDSRENKYKSFPHQATSDVPTTACSDTASPTAIGGAQTTAAGTWPCYHEITVLGGDQWGLAMAHVNDKNFLAYLMTADPLHLKNENEKTAWMMAWPNSSSKRANDSSWGTAVTASTTHNPRERTWRQRGLIRSFLLTPNVAQFGASVPSGETHYYNDQIWINAYAEEGLADIKDGMFAQHYQAQFPTSFATYDPSRDPNPWRYARYYVLGDRPNALGWSSNTWGAACGSWTYITCAPGIGRGPSGYQMTYSLVTFGTFEEMGFNHFYGVQRKLSALGINLLMNANGNGWLAHFYQQPGLAPTPLDVTPSWSPTPPPSYPNWHQTIAGWYGGFATSWLHQAGGATHEKATIATFNYINPNSATSSISYPAEWAGALSFMKNRTTIVGSGVTGCTAADAPPIGCTGSTAYDLWRPRVTSYVAEATFKDNPKVAFDPREEIRDLSIAPAGTSATITYTKPTTDICTYRVSTTAPSDTLDATDTSDGSGGLGTGTISLMGLTTASTYYLRLTCGTRLTPFATTGAVTGTTRTMGTFFTAGAPPSFLGTATGSSVIK